MILAIQRPDCGGNELPRRKLWGIIRIELRLAGWEKRLNVLDT